MGRGRSKAGGGQYAQQRVSLSNGASFKTVELVDSAIRGKEGDSLMQVRESLNRIREGQKISLYSAEFSSMGRSEINGVANDIVTYEKMDDGTWRGSNGTRKSNSDLAWQYYNSGFGRKLVPGEASTESHVSVGKGSTTVDGVKWTNGTYDIQANGLDGNKRGTRKVEASGKLATYNGTQYGITRQAGQYTVTHVDTGLRVGDAKSMSAATALVKQMDSQIKNINGLDEMTRRFKKTLRGD